MKEKNKKNSNQKKIVHLSQKNKNNIFGIVSFLLAVIIGLSFFNKAGIFGEIILKGLKVLIGKTTFFLPIILFLFGATFLFSKYQNFLKGLILAVFLIIFGISGFFNYYFKKEGGGWLGYYFSQLFFKLFGPWVTLVLFLGMTFIGFLIFWSLLKSPQILPQPEKKESFLKRAFKKVVRLPKLKVKEIPSEKEPKIEKEITSELKNKPISPPPPVKKYQPPPIDLLETEKGQPVSGDIRQNSLIIQKTLESFGIPVEMAQVNVGPTVTQYTLKPADGIKLSKITTLANDLALALAAHPIRIEAPIPGKSLVGIEVPNKVRSLVRLRELIANPQFQNSPSHLTFCLGRDVSGNPTYADLARMPHLLVSGSTGTGKTIFLNSLILSLLYRNSPEILRFVLIDPKRVEFLVYQEIPHLAYPVIFDVQKTIDILKKVILEMEKRFEILSEKKCRDILSFNELAQKEEKELMPYIVLIIDELADLMVARGREIEASIVRIAQLARAVGIHLVVATQRPSVEVITGLIKANITSRITFQVASQVDSRTVLDMAGAEKLLGRGDLLFLSAENPKPKRIQACYVSEKELKKVVNWLKANVPQKEFLWEILNQEILPEIAEEKEWLFDQEDPLYEEAKRIVIEAKKASASLLQRKLKIGYARAARLLDILEERGVVGPAQGAKPREVYFKSEEEENGQWQKI